MKYSNLFFAVLLLLFIAISCGSSPYKTRHRCRGNGSWYGNRNLGHKDFNSNKENTKQFVWIQNSNKDL